ncbi:hypothetical protein LTR46_009932 [Exophiala xenobiotica]|nr:hypothetical protein LTR46_009932 [Exophiala xenobiotica]
MGFHTSTTTTTIVERTRSTELMRILLSGEVSGEAPRELTPREKFRRWMVNEGSRRLFVGTFTLVHCMLYGFGFMNYTLKDNLSQARATYGYGYPIARSAALVLHFDVACILLPVCRTLISLARQTPLNGIIPFDKNITFHKLVGYSLVIFTSVHTIAHLHNVAQLSAKGHGGFIGFVKLNFLTGPGWTGYILTISIMAMFFTALDKPRRAHYERFWNTHHLFVLFFIMWSIHGIFCMIPADTKPACFGNGSFYQWWMLGGFTYLAECILREIRGTHKAYITKVIQHPSNVVEIQIKKEHTKTRAGQYIFLCCPEVSIWQYRPFTLTSAPEEDYISVHIRMVGDFTKQLGRVLGCEGLDKNEPKRVNDSARLISDEDNVKLSTLLPRLYIDGPFGSASEDVFKFETVLLIGAGIGVTPFASILKSIWYRMRIPLQAKLGCGRSIESEDKSHAIEIHAYLTAKITSAQASNIVLNSRDTDAITGLRTPTNFGRPNWDMVFRGIRKLHWPGECGVFFCGPKGLGADLHIKCNMYTEAGDKGFSFVWGKENF